MEIQKVKLQMIKDNSTIYTLTKITKPKEIVELVNAHERYDLAPTINVVVIALDNKNQVHNYAEIATGTINYANFSMSNMFKVVLLSNSNKFILVQNRPSGDTTPSQTDLRLTDEIKQASKIMGLEFLDHIIIGGEDLYTSIMSKKEEEKNE